MSKVKQLDFKGETIYCGLDAHKTNWKINMRMGAVELTGFSQNPDAGLLAGYCRKHYPGAEVKVVYEAGFCGFGIQRSLTELGIDCMVVNAADVPSSDKERKRKDDKRDARKLSRELAEGSLGAIYIPDIEMEQARTLVRQRYRLVQDQTRCKNRIKHMLMFSGVKLNIEQERWSQKYVRALEKVECKTPGLKMALQLALEEYGLLNGMVIQTELQDIGRFRTLDCLCDYAGLVPDIKSSDDRTVVKGITHRCNEFLREALIESSWTLVRKDPAMLMKYNEYRRRMNKNKAIIRIGKHLLSRIRYVWKNQTAYERGVVG